MYPPQSAFSPRMAGHWEEDGHSDPPSTRSSNDPPEPTAHSRSRSTAHAASPKRLSVFNGRSRSNTVTSSSSPSRRSPGSSMTSVDRCVPSLDDRTSSALGMRSEKDRSRSLLARGSRMLRRQGSKINVVATLDEEDEIVREHPRADKPDMFGRRARRVNNRKSLIEFLVHG